MIWGRLGQKIRLLPATSKSECFLAEMLWLYVLVFVVVNFVFTSSPVFPCLDLHLYCLVPFLFCVCFYLTFNHCFYLRLYFLFFPCLLHLVLFVICFISFYALLCFCQYVCFDYPPKSMFYRHILQSHYMTLLLLLPRCLSSRLFVQLSIGMFTSLIAWSCDCLAFSLN